MGVCAARRFKSGRNPPKNWHEVTCSIYPVNSESINPGEGRDKMGIVFADFLDGGDFEGKTGILTALPIF
jgi:hypothetical protein